MSLLLKGREDILIFPEEVYTDADGNTMGRSASVGIPAKAAIQIQNQSGTSSRRQERQEEGFETERVYRIRLPRNNTIPITAQAQIEWQGVRWAVFGDVKWYNGSRRTAHTDFAIRRY